MIRKDFVANSIFKILPTLLLRRGDQVGKGVGPLSLNLKVLGKRKGSFRKNKKSLSILLYMLKID